MQVKLKVLSGSSAGRELKISSDEFVIGRSDACHLRPKTDSISRKHCVLRMRDGRLFVEDLQSRNGTFLDKVRITEETEAQHGNRLKLGRLEFEVVIQKSPAPVKAEKTRPDAPTVSEKVKLEEESWVDDDEITKWLEEGDSASQSSRKSSPETRQFRLDETERDALETKVIQAVDSDTKTGVDLKPGGKKEGKEGNKEESQEGSKEDSKELAKAKAEKSKKKQPGKLPPRPSSTSTDSRQAASEMLKRFFNRP
jgi:pSer/pThr/pTyr-binding forkhead associated (FHA) protein